MKKYAIKKHDVRKCLKKLEHSVIVDRLNLVEWILLCIVLILITVTLFYDDNLGIFLSYFWVNNNALRGRNLNFLGNRLLSYGIVQQYFGELWCLPLNIIYLVHPFTVHGTAAVIWYKLSMAIVFLFSLREMIKIGKLLEIDEDKIKWMLILFCSTVLVSLPVFHIAQTDILYGYLVLLSLRSYIEENWKRFILFGAMAISCKGIAIVVLIPLILLREKKVFKVIRDSILSVSIFVGERIWYRIVDTLNNAIWGSKISSSSLASGTETAIEINAGNDILSAGLIPHFYHKSLFFEFGAVRKGYVASLLVFLFSLLCIWCYVQKKEDIKEYRRKSLYTVTIAWLLFFVNASPSPYWIVVLYPFLFLLMFINFDRIRLNMLLETGFTLTMFLVYLVDTFWVYGGANNLDYLILKGIVPDGHVSTTDGPYVARYLINLGIGSIMNVITAVCLACAVGIIVVNYYKINLKEDFDSKYEKYLMHGFTLFQIGFLYVWYAVVVFVVSRW